MMLCLTFLAVFLNLGLCSGKEEIVTVKTTTGTIRGNIKQVDEGRLAIDVFFGIPYATPPQRFEKTVPLPANPDRLVDAFEMPPVCVPHHRLDNWTSDWNQYSEDCLYLNLFAPHQSAKPMKMLPILVLFYTAGFQSQSMRRYKDFEDIGKKYLSRGIIVVAVQFRIGFFGFSSTGDPQMAGNFGYWDIAEALRWIQSNAAAFGGNPERITLFGYSASSTAVTTLGVSPYTRDLFQQAIQMSGSVFTSRAASNRVVDITRRLAIHIGCDRTWGNSTELKECFRDKSIDQFLDEMDRIGPTLPDMNYDLFGPIFDGDFLPSDFEKLINEAKPRRTIMGVTESDPLGYTLFMGNNSLRQLAIPKAEIPYFGAQQFREYLRQKVIKTEFFGPRQEEAIARVADFYLAYDRPSGVPGNWFFLERIVHMLADIQFLYPLAKEVHTKRGWPLFLYRNTYVNARRFPPEIPIHKCFHDNDHMYVFRHPYMTYEFDEQDIKMEQQMVQFVANFITKGDPSTTEIEWPMVSKEKPFLHMEVDLTPTIQDEDFTHRGLNFWTQMVAEFPEWDVVMGRPAEGNWAQMAMPGKFWLLLVLSTMAFPFIIVNNLL